MPRLPTLSGREVVRGLQRLGFDRVSQSGSHIKLRRKDRTVIVPDHREVRKGTLSNILKQAGISLNALVAALAH